MIRIWRYNIGKMRPLYRPLTKQILWRIQSNLESIESRIEGWSINGTEHKTMTNDDCRQHGVSAHIILSSNIKSNHVLMNPAREASNKIAHRGPTVKRDFETNKWIWMPTWKTIDPQTNCSRRQLQPLNQHQSSMPKFPIRIKRSGRARHIVSDAAVLLSIIVKKHVR
jgi:hypothetical protein